MGVAHWMRVVETVGNLAQFADRFRQKPSAAAAPDVAPPVGTGTGLEARLAGVVVAALKEAFDRDRVRMDLEREQIEAERRRAQQALDAEIRRQAADRAVGQLRLVAVIAASAWMLSAALGVWLDGMRGGVPRALLACGWLSAFATIGCAFAGWQRTTQDTAGGGIALTGGPAAAAPWLLLGALTLIGASLLVAL
jgi:hypothetical protein